MSDTDPTTSQLLVEFGKVSNKLDGVKDELSDVKTTVAVAMEKLADLPDHEKRLRSLEKWKYGLPLSALIAIASIVLAVYGVVKGH